MLLVFSSGAQAPLFLCVDLNNKLEREVTRTMGLATMDAFGNMFPNENNATTKARKDYEAAVAAANGSPSKLKEAEREYTAALSSIASATLKRDKELKITTPFILDTELKKQIEQNVPYYVHEHIIGMEQYPHTCLVCGKKQKKGQVMITVNNSAGEATCFNCADNKTIIDNRSYSLKVLV